MRPLLIVAIFVSSLFAQSGTQPQQQNTVELIIRLTDEKDRPFTNGHRVQLVNMSGMTLAETFTTGNSEAIFPEVRSGAYRIKASGPEIDDLLLDTSFQVDARSGLTHTQFVRAARKPLSAQPSSRQTTISTAELNIPDNARKAFEKGAKAMRSGDPSARKYFEEASRLYPQYAAAFINLGILDIRERDLDGAERYFQQAVTADENFANGYLNLAKVRMLKKNTGGQLALLSKAVTLDPMNAESLLYLAKHQLDAGQDAAAAETAQRVHQLPHDSMALAHVFAAKALERLQQHDSAIAEYELFLKEAPRSSQSKSVKQDISRLRAAKR